MYLHHDHLHHVHGPHDHGGLFHDGCFPADSIAPSAHHGPAFDAPHHVPDHGPHVTFGCSTPAGTHWSPSLRAYVSDLTGEVVYKL